MKSNNKQIEQIAYYEMNVLIDGFDATSLRSKERLHRHSGTFSYTWSFC